MEINLPGFTARTFAGPQDFAPMAALLQVIASQDQSMPWITAEQLESDYSHLENCDPFTDQLMVVDDASGRLVACTRLFWLLNDENCQSFRFALNIHPQWRTLELNQAMLAWVEARAVEIVEVVAHPGRRSMLPMIRNALIETNGVAAFEAQGFQTVRFIDRMVRDLNEPIELLPVPAGLELRPVPPDQYRALTLATDEAFRDHWGHSPFSDEAYQQWIAGPEFKPGLWKVAWDGDQIAGGVLNFYDENANLELKVKRGWTDPIFTRRPWRKRGLARALIMLSLQMFKEMGFSEAMLSVDTLNPSGALGLYESCGYKPVLRSVLYEKELG